MMHEIELTDIDSANAIKFLDSIQNEKEIQENKPPEPTLNSGQLKRYQKKN